jgi:hypothetical protein
MRDRLEKRVVDFSERQSAIFTNIPQRMEPWGREEKRKD